MYLPASSRALTIINKIKLRTSGYRLVYEVIDDDLVVMVIVIGKREGSRVYEIAKDRSKA